MTENTDGRVELPPGWVWAKLGELGAWGSGGTPSRTNPRYFGGDIPWIKIGDLPDGPIQFIEEAITREGLANSAATLLPPGTLLVAMYGASIGKIGVTTSECTTNQAIAHCMPAPGVELFYLFFVVRSIRHRLIRLGQGGAQPNISQAILKQLEIPLAPTAEQRRIVSRIEELFGEIEAGEQELEKAREGLAAYRRAVLKAAVTGELTREWREKNTPNETGADLLAGILVNRRRSWEGDQLRKSTTLGKVPPKNWKAKYEQPIEPDISNLPVLPVGWCWTTIDQLTALGRVDKGYP